MTQASQDAEEVKKLLANPDEQNQDREPQTQLPAIDVLSEPFEEEPAITLHVHHFPDALVIIKDPGDHTDERVIESVMSKVQPDATPGGDQEQKPEQEAQPPPPPKKSFRHAILTASFYLFLIVSSLFLQSSLPLYAPTATITIIPQSQGITYTGMLQLGRVIAPITVTQSQTAPATGKGHQDARQATGSITFYNGLFSEQTIAAGTILTGENGIQVITDQTAFIPAGNPPIYGQATVFAHTLTFGSVGNIRALDIDTTLSASVFAKNTAPFTGGQDERDFSTVRQQDINTLSTSLKTSLAQSVTGALQGQLQPNEQLSLLPCTPTVTSDHRPGQEASQVKVTASETCSAVAYNKDALQTKATDLLSQQAIQNLGTSYSLIGDVQTSITQAVVTHTIPTLVFTCQGTWVYALSQEAQQQLKQLIAGKPKQEAITLLLSLPGIEKASIRWDENTKLPENLDALHLVIFVPNS